jgi:hypothetical protein
MPWALTRRRRRRRRRIIIILTIIMDFFLWGHIKTLIYSSPVDSEKDLIDRIIEAAATWHF